MANNLPPPPPPTPPPYRPWRPIPPTPSTPWTTASPRPPLPFCQTCGSPKHTTLDCALTKCGICITFGHGAQNCQLDFVTMEQASDAREASQTRMPDTVLPSFRENFRDIIEEAGQTDRLGQHIANYVAAYEGKRTELRLLKEENAKLRKENRELWHDNRALHEDREEMRANWNAGNMNELRAKDEQIATLQRVRDRLQESQRAKDEKIGMLQQVVEKGTSRDEKIMILRQLNEKQSQDMTKKDLEINRLEWKMVEKNAELNTMWENLRRQF